jgi:hypothetical protein
MNIESLDGELVGRLKRLDAASVDGAPGFDYQGMLHRHAAGKLRARRRANIARGTASVLVLAMVAVTAWRLAPRETLAETAPVVAEEAALPEQRLVRADTYLALAAIEEHIATIDDALSDARVAGPRGADVARLERARADLLDSYASVRYADRVAANF